MQQDGNNLGSDSDSETTGSAYVLESVKINRKIVYKGEKEEQELEGIEEEGDKGVEGEGENLRKIEEKEGALGEERVIFEKVEESEEASGGGADESKSNASEEEDPGKDVIDEI